MAHSYGIVSFLLVLLCLSSGAQASNKYSSKGLAYCLGEADYDAHLKAATTEIEKKNAKWKMLAPEMRKLAKRDADQAALLRAQLTKMGIDTSRMRAAEASMYDDGYTSEQLCLAHSQVPCVQTCYKSGHFPNEMQGWGCEKTCGLPQSCKREFDCRQFDKSS